MLDLSIVLPTCNRAASLEKTLASLAGVGLEHEIIVVDGASTDRTQDVLAEASIVLGERLHVIREDQRRGFVAAANLGFQAARGRCMTWLNDDSRPLPGCLESAVQILDQSPSHVAFVAMFHAWHSTMNVAYELAHHDTVYRLCHVRGTLYANFPMGYRDTYERLGFFDEGFFMNGADPDLSLKAWFAGLTVTPGWGCMIDHDEIDDDRRAGDIERGAADNRRLFEKWDLPPRNSFCNSFDPASPCSLRKLRDVLAIAA